MSKLERQAAAIVTIAALAMLGVAVIVGVATDSLEATLLVLAGCAVASVTVSLIAYLRLRDKR